MIEVWRSIDSVGEGYEVSNLGRVRSTDRTISMTSKNGKKFDRFFKGKIMSQGYSNFGYKIVTLASKKRTYMVHRLVAEAFVEGDNSLVVDHIDRNKTNNRADNLRWVTSAENSKNKRSPQSKPVRCSTFDIDFQSAKEAANFFGLSKTAVSQICFGRRNFTRDGLSFSYINGFERKYCSTCSTNGAIILS